MVKVKLDQFNKRATCRKCGSRDISTNFCESGEQSYSSTFGHQEPSHSSGRIHRSCGSCGYDWDELPLDSSPPKVRK